MYLPLCTHVSRFVYSNTLKNHVKKKEKINARIRSPHSDDDDDEQHTHERFDAVHKHHPEVRADTPRRCVIDEFLFFAKLSSSNVVKRRERNNENAAPSSSQSKTTD